MGKMDKDNTDQLEKDKAGCKKQVEDNFAKAMKDTCCKQDTKPALELDIKSAARKTMHVAVWTIVIMWSCLACVSSASSMVFTHCAANKQTVVRSMFQWMHPLVRSSVL